MSNGNNQHEPTVFVIDDDPTISGRVGELADTMNLRCECYFSGEEFLEAYDGFRPGCIVLEVRIPGVSGFSIQERLAAVGDAIPLIFLAERADVSIAVRAMRLGALHFLVKPFREDELWDTVLEAVRLDQDRRHSQQRRQEVIRRVGLLTDKERQVLEQFGRGRSNAAIARELNVSERMVQYHRGHLMKKLRADSHNELVYLAVTYCDGNGRPRGAREGQETRVC